METYLQYLERFFKDFNGSRSGHFGILPASEVNILPNSGKKKIPVAEDPLVCLTLKVLSFIFFCHSNIRI